ncbi:MAG: sugar kinase [Clostridia bacterium]|nr:sugar kinase [Clostridia bacterium]
MKVVTFGELMLRLAPNGYYRFFQNDQMQATFGGGEANVAVSLAGFGLDSTYVTKLPTHAIGQAAVDSLRAFGVDTSKVIRGGDRVGIYFLEKGYSQRASVCIYDRAHSAIAQANPEDFDWNRIFDGADWFHFAGITPALGGALLEICLDACKAAKEKGVKISFDPNYRAKLWSLEHASEAMRKLLPYVDLLIVNEQQAQELFGVSIPASERNDATDETTDEGYRVLCETFRTRYAIPKIALTERRTFSAEENRICGKLYDGTTLYTSKQYRVHIIDRVGGGDAFDAGLIYALLIGKEPQQAIEFAVAASALKHSVEGDYNRVSVNEVEKLAGGDDSSRVQR